MLIIEVVPGGAADRAGLHGGNQRAYLGNVPLMVGGDLIIGIDGEQVADQQDLADVLNRHKAGETINVTVLRGRRKLEVKVVLGEAREQT